MENQNKINNIQALGNPRLGNTKPKMATRDTEVKQYSHDSYGSTNCIEESISDIIPDTCIPIRDRTREEITDLPVCFLNNNTNTVPFNVLYGADTVENKLGTRRFVVGGALTVSMVIDNDRIKSNGTSTALEKNVNEVEGQNTQIKGQACHLDKFQIFDNCTSGPTTLQNNKSQLNDKRKEEKCTKGSTKCIFTQGSSTKEQEKKPTPRENPKALYEDQRKGRNGCFIKEHSGFKKDSEISSPSDEILKKRRNKRQVKDQAAVPPGSHGSLIKEDSGFQKNSEIFSPSGEIPKKKRAQRIEKKQDAVPTSLHVVYIQVLIIYQFTPCSFAQNPDHRNCHLKFRGELDHEKLSLKCYHGIPCPGTKKWTGGIEGLQLYKGVKKETPSGKIYECVVEKSWFAMIIRNWTDADIFSQYKCWNKFKEYSVILNEQPILYKTGDDDPIKCNDENKEMTMLTMNVTVLHTSQQPSFTYDTEIENFTQNLMVSQRPEKMGPWFITDIYAEIIRENNVNKTFYLKYKDNKTFTIIEEFVHCNGSKGTWPDFKDKSSMVVVVSSVCVVIIALAVLLGCCRKKISEFCSRQGRGRSYTDTSTSNSDLANQTVLEPFIMN